MSKNRFRRIAGDGHFTERSKEIREYPGGNYRGKHRKFRASKFPPEGRTP
jgi:hypothetical protein